MRWLVRVLAWLPVGWVGLAVAASHCGGVAFESGTQDASVGTDAARGGSSGGSSGSSSSGSATSGGSGSGTSGSATSDGGGSGSGSSGGATSGSSGSAGSSSGGATSGGATSGGGSGTASSGGGGSGSMDAGGSGVGASDGGGACAAACGFARLCCGATCVNPANDPFNCGGCGIKCAAGTYCDGSCQPIPCARGAACASGETCCGNSCCVPGRLCCPQAGPIAGGLPSCITPTPTQPTCPQGCAPLCVSDRNLKRDIEPVNEQAVLESIARMPISTWSYKSEDPSVRHLGPMAQDFSAAFGLGSTDRAYDPIDAHGVELAAIKALYERIEKEHTLIESLERENEELRQHAACGR